MQNEKKQERVSFDVFRQSLKELVENSLGNGFQVVQTRTQKNNGVWKQILLVREESKECAPSFYLDGMYDSYCTGQPIEALAEYITDTIRNGRYDEICDVKQVLSGDWFEKRLFLRLVHFEKNKEQLEDAVYVRVLDLAAVFYVLTEIAEDGMKSFRLPRNVWEQACLGQPEEYYDTILQNTERLFPVQLMQIEAGILNSMKENGEEIPEWLLAEFLERQQKKRPPLFFVLTNTAKLNGAATILYKGELERLRERFGKGFYIIPSSVHEVLLLPETSETEETLNRMVREVNETQVPAEDVLSEHVYYYDTVQGFCSSSE